jgi:4'-phosphopantetheinyl transferase
VPFVELRIADLDVDGAEVRRLHHHLAPDEQARAQRFRFEQDRRRFIVRRGLLREWLADHLNGRPERLRFTAGEWGKPALRDHPCHFSLSHSGERVTVAISHAEVGCDIEQIDDRFDWLAIAEQFLRPCELAELRVLAPANARAAFFRLWARMEASLKATGRGLSGPQSFALEASVPAAWQLADVDIDPGYAAAVACASDDTPLQLTIRHFGTQLSR